MAPPQPGYGTTAKRKRSSASLTETKQDLRPEQDHSRSGSAPSTSWAECRDKKGSAPSRRKEMSLDIPLYRTCPISRLSRNLLISPFKSRNRPGQVPGTSDASKTQSGLIGTLAANSRRLQ